MDILKISPYLTTKFSLVKLPYEETIDEMRDLSEYPISNLDKYLQSYVFFTKDKNDHRSQCEDSTNTQFKYRDGKFVPYSWKSCFISNYLIDYDIPTKIDEKMWNNIIKMLTKQHKIITTKTPEYIKNTYDFYGVKGEDWYYNIILVKKEK